MSKRVIATVFAVLFASLLLVATPVLAQVDEGEGDSPPPVEVAPDVVEQTTTTTTTVEVQEEVVARPLPRTGGDIGGTVILGLGLTAFGIVLAVGARRRRNRFDTVT